MASLIKDLSEINAVCGNEDKIREFIVKYIKADSVDIDTMGNLIAYKKGTDSSHAVIIASHMDESGFIVSGITEKGYLKFKNAGNIDPNTLISKKVVIGDNGVKGVIGMKAIHLQTREERKNTVPVQKLYIDIGASSKKNASKRVKIGDFVAFDTECVSVGQCIKGKALSRACGISAILAVMEKECHYDIYFVFTVQKMIGARGADIISRRINADIVITIDTVSADDIYKNELKTVKLGEGAVITYSDKFALYNRSLSDMTVETAKKYGIPYQKSIHYNGFSDAGPLQYGALGSKCINISIPCRYANTPVEMISAKDMACTELLLGKIIENIKQFMA